MTTMETGRQEALDHVLVDRYTDVVGPSNEMLGPVRDGGRIEYLTVPGCWGPMITPSIRSGHEVTLPVRVEGAEVGDAVALHVERLEQVSRATTSGTHEGWDGRFLSDPFVAGICPTCRDEGRHFLYPDTYLDGLGHAAVRCSACHGEVIPFRMIEGYTMVFDDDQAIGVTVTGQRAEEIAGDGRAWVGLPDNAAQHPITVLAKADLVGTMTRCRISAGNLGSIPAIDLPSSHNCGDFGAFLVGAEHEFAVTEEQLEARTDVHMDVDSVREGATVVVPVKVDGAGIYAGDVHAMIGDGEIAVHTTDIGARLVVRVEVVKGLTLDGPLLLPPVEDLPFLARPFAADEVERARQLADANATVLEGAVLPIQVLGSGPFVNAAVDNAVERAARLLDLSVHEVRNRGTIAGAVEIGRLPGFVQLSLQVPRRRLEALGVAGLVEQAYGPADGW
ncbi:acetamidase/formamidase family protein [Egicoccus sp. AB-alg2]|uniref:acetamidase/formamidase family protein n=1 Tax=Egicoccus sp. AB-alg2 TaxID=3242693 RepID=UPI00359D27A4